MVIIYNWVSPCIDSNKIMNKKRLHSCHMHVQGAIISMQRSHLRQTNEVVIWCHMSYVWKCLFLFIFFHMRGYKPFLWNVSLVLLFFLFCFLFAFLIVFHSVQKLSLRINLSNITSVSGITTWELPNFSTIFVNLFIEELAAIVFEIVVLNPRKMKLSDEISEP